MYSCEVRPGPEYVLRQYRFYDGGLFDLRLFHYSDSYCRSPTYSLTARGHYRPYQTSWIVAGATEMDYHLWHVAVVPYQTAVSMRRLYAAAPMLRRRQDLVPNGARCGTKLRENNLKATRQKYCEIRAINSDKTMRRIRCIGFCWIGNHMHESKVRLFAALKWPEKLNTWKLSGEGHMLQYPPPSWRRQCFYTVL